MTVALLGLLAGLVAGFFGVGGGVLFVPAMTLVAGMAVVDAEATSLLAIVPVALVGAVNQRRYGNLRLGDAVALGLFAVPAALLGVVIVNNVSEAVVRAGFSGLALFTAYKLARSGLQERRAAAPASDRGA